MYQKENAQPRNAELSASEPSANATAGFVLAPLHSQQPMTMSSLEIAGETGKDHAHVMRDIRGMMASLATNPDLDPCAISTTYTGKDGRQYRQYALDKDTCMTLLLGYDPVARMKVVKRWQALEAQQALALPNFADPVAAARAWADAKEGEQKAVAQLALVAPQLEYVDRYVAAKGALGFRQVAKLLNAKEPELRAFLEESRIFYRLAGVLTPYQNHIDAGRFTIKTGVSQFSEHAFAQARFTPKGVEWIAGLWMQRQVCLEQGSEVAA